MKKFIVLIILIAPGDAYCQESPLEFIRNFFDSYPPCVKTFYCYDYKFEVDRENLIITTKLFNYEGDQLDQKVLTEETKYLIPVDQIEAVQYFPSGSEDIYISTYDDKIERHRNGKRQLFRLLPLDFNKYELTVEVKKAFEENFDLVLDSFE